MKEHRDYTRQAMRVEDLAEDPFDEFLRWYEEAQAADVFEPYAAVLATKSPDGQPEARMVMIREYSGCGFEFFTSYESAKGRYKSAPSYVAQASIEKSADVHARALASFGEKYSAEWGKWGPRFQKGLASGDRVLIRYHAPS